MAKSLFQGLELVNDKSYKIKKEEDEEEIGEKRLPRKSSFHARKDHNEEEKELIQNFKDTKFEMTQSTLDFGQSDFDRRKV